MQINLPVSYRITMDKIIDKESIGYLGKVKSNKIGTEFIIFKKGSSTNKRLQRKMPYGNITYEIYPTKEFDSKKITIMLPGIEIGEVQDKTLIVFYLYIIE